MCPRLAQLSLPLRGRTRSCLCHRRYPDSRFVAPAHIHHLASKSWHECALHRARRKQIVTYHLALQVFAMEYATGFFSRALSRPEKPQKYPTTGYEQIHRRNVEEENVDQYVADRYYAVHIG